MSEDKAQGSTGADANEEKRALNEVSMKSIFSCVKSDLRDLNMAAVRSSST